jgi:hypothetical protein
VLIAAIGKPWLTASDKGCCPGASLTLLGGRVLASPWPFPGRCWRCSQIRNLAAGEGHFLALEGTHLARRCVSCACHYSPFIKRPAILTLPRTFLWYPIADFPASSLGGTHDRIAIRKVIHNLAYSVPVLTAKARFIPSTVNFRSHWSLF